jgi:hypothetical protein
MSVCYSFKPVSGEEIQVKLDQLLEEFYQKCQKERLEGRTLTFEFKNSKFMIT